MNGLCLRSQNPTASLCDPYRPLLQDMIITALARDIDFQDYTGLHKLLVAAFSYMDERIDPPSSLRRLNSEGLREKAANEVLILALYGQELAGCLFARPEKDSIYIGKVAVRHDIRGQGVGKKLLQRAEQIAHEENCDELVLEVRVELTENHRFFEKEGFVKSGESAHEGYTGATSFTFCKKVNYKL